MSNVDVFDITVSQLEHFSNVAYEDLSDLDCINKYMVVETWSWFGQQPSSMMVSCDPTADKEKALRFADGLYTNDLMANRMGISRSGNHYEVWHVVEDPTPTPSMDGYEGEGWYTVSYSDGGQDYTNDGPVWVEDVLSFAELMAGAMESATDTHLPYAEFRGNGEGGSSPVYQRDELLSYLGAYVDEYDVDAIELEVTKYDPIRGCLVWMVFGDDLSDVCVRHELPCPPPDAYEYVRAIDQIF